VSTGDSTGTAPPPSPSGGTTGAQGLPVQCGYGVSASTGTTCAFAENAFYEYWKASDGGSSPSENISAWSADGGQSYPLSCDLGDGVVDCTGTDGSGISLDARFSQSAISAYTTSQATAYAASGKLGPTNNASSGGLTPGDQNPNDASAADCDGTMEIGPRSDCFVAQKVAGDLGKGVWSAPGADTVSEGSSTLTFNCSVVGHDDSQSSRPAIYRCVSDGDSADWFEFEFT
jgi:hypothetical protein